MIKSALGFFVPQFGEKLARSWKRAMQSAELSRAESGGRKSFSGGNTRCSLKIELCDKLRAPSRRAR